jgi:hypothetical protein
VVLRIHEHETVCIAGKMLIYYNFYKLKFLSRGYSLPKSKVVGIDDSTQTPLEEATRLMISTQRITRHYRTLPTRYADRDIFAHISPLAHALLLHAQKETCLRSVGTVAPTSSRRFNEMC